MAQIRSSYNEIEIPFAKMSWNSDVPSSQLGPNEYNHGINIETDVRGIKTVLGSTAIPAHLPTWQVAAAPAPYQGQNIYVTGGFRTDGTWYYIVALYGNPPIGSTYPGQALKWFMIDESMNITNITPGYATDVNAFVPYGGVTVNITEAWNGTTLIINDSRNPPYFLTGDSLEFEYYSNQCSVDINGITQAAGTATISFTTPPNIPYAIGDKVTITNSFPPQWNTNYIVTGVPTSTSIEVADPGYSAWDNGGILSPTYQWNYNPDWNLLSAGFLRIYNAPNIGSVLIAGNLRYREGKLIIVDLNSTVTVTCSTASLDWVGYEIYGAGIPTGATIVSVVAGVSFNISSAATLTVAGTTVGIQATTDSYAPNTVRWSQNFGLNDLPLTWAPTITNVANELEVPLRGKVLDGYPAGGNFYVASYWDTVVFSPIAYQTTQIPVFGVRLFNNGRGLLSSNCWANADDKVYGIDSRDWWVFDGNNFTPLGNQRVKNYLAENMNPNQYAVEYFFMENNTSKNQVEFYFNNTDSGGNPVYPNSMISYRYDLDIFNPPYNYRQSTSTAFSTAIASACEAPVYRAGVTDYSTRTISLLPAGGLITANNVAFYNIHQKDTDFGWAPLFYTSPRTNVYSEFSRDNIQLLKDYSGQLLVHRILPEVNNINIYGREVYTNVTTTVTFNVGGSDSAGETPTMNGNISFTIDTTEPWVQIDQNAYRLNTLEFSYASSYSAIIINSVTWQITQTQDAR